MFLPLPLRPKVQLRPHSALSRSRPDPTLTWQVSSPHPGVPETHLSDQADASMPPGRGLGAASRWPDSARSSSPIRSPAATTAAACSRPGERVSRSIGPDTEMAASTLPPWPRTGAETEATPASRSAALAAQPRRRTPARVGRGEPGAAQPAVHPLALLPGEQHLGGRAGDHRQRAADRHGVPQPACPLRGRDADPDVGLPPVKLRAFPCHVAKLVQYRLGDGEQPVLAGRRGELGDPRAEHEPALHIPGQQPVMLEGNRDPVRGWPREPGRRDELRQRGRTALHRGEHRQRLVEHADATAEAALPAVPRPA